MVKLGGLSLSTKSLDNNNKSQQNHQIHHNNKKSTTHNGNNSLDTYKKSLARSGESSEI